MKLSRRYLNVMKDESPDNEVTKEDLGNTQNFLEREFKRALKGQ